MGLKKALKEYKERGKNSLSSFYLINSKELRQTYINEVCYAPVTGQEGIKGLWVFQPHISNSIPYANFVLNSKWMGNVFITKSFEDGYENGFEVNVDTPANLLRAGIISLRSAFEHPSIGIAFNYLKELGYTDEESFFFGTLFFREIYEFEDYPINSVRTPIHGVQLTNQVLLKDVIEGNHYELLPSASKCARSSYHMTGPTDALVKNYNPHRWNNVFLKHSKVIETKYLGGRLIEIPYSKGNLEEFISLYKKEYSLD